MTAAPKDLHSTLKNLTIHPTPSKSSSAFAKAQPESQAIADSWEDEDSGTETDRPLSPQQSADYPSAPPPTPISPTSGSYGFQNMQNAYASPYGYGTDGAGDVRERGNGVRPEKTDAVAKRMIAGALGVRAPKKTDEQRAYDKAVREKEVKRRERERDEVEKAKVERERAKVAVWED